MLAKPSLFSIASISDSMIEEQTNTKMTCRVQSTFMIKSSKFSVEAPVRHFHLRAYTQHQHIRARKVRSCACSSSLSEEEEVSFAASSPSASIASYFAIRFCSAAISCFSNRSVLMLNIVTVSSVMFISAKMSRLFLTFASVSGKRNLFVARQTQKRPSSVLETTIFVSTAMAESLLKKFRVKQMARVGSANQVFSKYSSSGCSDVGSFGISSYLSLTNEDGKRKTSSFNFQRQLMCPCSFISSLKYLLLPADGTLPSRERISILPAASYGTPSKSSSLIFPRQRGSLHAICSSPAHYRSCTRIAVTRTQGCSLVYCVNTFFSFSMFSWKWPSKLQTSVILRKTTGCSLQLTCRNYLQISWPVV